MCCEELLNLLALAQREDSGNILIGANDNNRASFVDFAIAEDIATVTGREYVVDVDDAEGNLLGLEGLEP